MRRACRALVIAGVTGLATVAGAQVPDTTTRPPRALRPGTWVRLHVRPPLPSGVRTAYVSGRLLAPTDSVLRLSSPERGPAREIPWAAADSVWVRSGSHWRAGAVVGGIAGAGALSVLSRGLSGMHANDRDCVESCAAWRGAGAGLVVGAALGALGGRMISRWSLHSVRDRD